MGFILQNIKILLKDHYICYFLIARKVFLSFILDKASDAPVVNS